MLWCGGRKKIELSQSLKTLWRGHPLRNDLTELATLRHFSAAGEEMVSNRPEDHEISMLALHLIQNCMVYINTLMIQKVLAQPHWHGRLTPRDYAALTPLIWEHVNPYGRFDLDMNARLALL
jgi:hypothetical protein